ncbi:DUF1501 domain-containing protein [Chryseolinea sp. T2]|uniref:DUF1501 domain-containing protein n=1 Tax=Chryseolinea sp. T2 TaxID=3129255 RepID=UPI003076CDB7
MSTRRAFLKQSILGTAGTVLVPHFLKAYEKQCLYNQSNQRRVIIIQLSGGNDGLNTVIPYRNDLYYQTRPTIAIGADKVLKAGSELGFHPSLQPLNTLFDDGLVAVMNNVGYPNPDRSHFRSMDIWHTASESNEYLETGWIGRYLDAACTSCSSPMAIEVDDTLSLAMKGEVIKGMAVQDVNKLYRGVHRELYQDVARQSNHTKEMDPTLNYLYKTMADTSSSAEYLHEKTRTTTSREAYPTGPFANRLRSIAELIHAQVDTRVFYVSLSGFDTHVNQLNQHQRLLTTYSEGLHAFVEDLGKEQMKDVLIMTFSEFGRRVQQNASGGTDHGTANNIFMISGSLKKKGFLNETPDLSRLDEGDLIHRVDFRSVYATILDKWLEVSSQRILKQSFTLADFI